MKLHEEFKLFEEMWEDNSVDMNAPVKITDDGCIHINCKQLTEGVKDWFSDLSNAGGNVIIAKCLQVINKLDYTKVMPMLRELLAEAGLDSFGELEMYPVSLNKERVAWMMKYDLDRLSAREWAKKWYTGFLENGKLSINPADYPDMDWSGLVDKAKRAPGD